MGYHWFNHTAIEDVTLDALRPEGLVYESLPNGKLRLLAVEWIVPAEAWHDAENEEPPTVLGRSWGSSIRRSAGTSFTPGCGSRIRPGCSRTGTPRSSVRDRGRNGVRT